MKVFDSNAHFVQEHSAPKASCTNTTIKHIKYDKLKCPHCEWSFSERGNLNAHVTRKHENEKFYCDRCEKAIIIFGQKEASETAQETGPTEDTALSR